MTRPSITNVRDFLDDLTAVRSRVGQGRLFYRGHEKASYELKPGIGRVHRYAGKKYEFDPMQERHVLGRFRRYAYQHLRRQLTAWEALFLGRHHGLPTRMLDWTRSPLTALFFACAEAPGETGQIWAFRHSPQRQRDRENILSEFLPTEDPLSKYEDACSCCNPIPNTNDAVKVVYPLYNSPRILAQEGVFTLHSNPWKALDAYQNTTFCPKRLDIDILVRWRVRASCKRKINQQLEALGISRRVLFPDLDGLAKSLVDTLVLWRGRNDRRD